MVKAAVVGEHEIHPFDAGGIPRADVPVEGRGVPKHVLHTRDAGNIPITDVLVERPGVVEHAVHLRGVGYIPMRKIFIKPHAIERISKICYLTCIPS